MMRLTLGEPDRVVTVLQLRYLPQLLADTSYLRMQTSATCKQSSAS